ncbi:Conserved repeat domain-containing protein/Por secretion system C-terminal sorting domain-containing protein [Flavobacterium longum]|uniref:DUF7619 domain-containing protein n=1 Tax=Flavobacterium longum TaxID=1299340 RepID=UPI0039EC3E86
MKKLLLFLALSCMFCGAAQNLISVTPNSGLAGETLQVTITGENTNFTSASGVEGVSFYNNMSSEFFSSTIQVLAPDQMTIMLTIPNNVPTGAYDVTVFSVWPFPTMPAGFYVTNNNNVISGIVRLDVNGNGCDASDPPRPGVKVFLNDGTNSSYTFTDSSGYYSFYVGAGNFTVTPQPELPYFTVAPASGSANFATVDNLSQTADFCLSANGTHNDVDIMILPQTAARPGFDATYKLVYKNKGNQTMSGALSFTFDDSRLDFISASSPPSSQTTNNLAWTYADLLPFETRTVTFVLNVNSPVETPAVNIGDILNFIAAIDPLSGDETPNDNTDLYTQIVVGSFDPNDKTVLEGSSVHIDNAGDYLHYLIRFQNSGNFMAENIRVEDLLSANLDPSTLQVVAASHSYRSTLTNGNRLQFFFDNINLPPESEDEPGSNGFVSFKIKPVNTVAIGTTIENTADIYFDFNFPIITNTVSTTFTTLGNPSYGVVNNVVLCPNPATSTLNIRTDLSAEIMHVKIVNQLGQVVKVAQPVSGTSLYTINVDDLAPGIYIVQVASQTGMFSQKLIKR